MGGEPCRGGPPDGAGLHSRLCGLQKRTYSAFRWSPSVCPGVAHWPRSIRGGAQPVGQPVSWAVVLSWRGTPSGGPLQDVPAIAVSLDNYLARNEEQYATAATYTVALMKASTLPGPG